ncbi:hypothetical protein Ancab_024242 [Ancistrocladus abbreviatus]
MRMRLITINIQQLGFAQLQSKLNLQRRACSPDDGPGEVRQDSEACCADSISRLRSTARYCLAC